MPVDRVKVLVAGADGQLGSAMRADLEAHAESYDVLSLGHDAFDLTDHAQIGSVLGRERPDAVVNCAAFNDVDGAEARADVALRVNTLGVGELARRAAALGACLVHVSTDFVFDGAGDRAYTEEDAPRPRSTYAATKLMGEWLARDAGRYLVLRVASLFGGDRPTSTVDRIVEALVEGRPVRAFADRTISPAFVVDVAAAIRMLIEREAASGVYHCTNGGRTTWHGLAVEAARLLGTEATIEAVSVDTIEWKAQRPRHSPLATDKLARLGIMMPTWQDALRRAIEQRRLREAPPSAGSE